MERGFVLARFEPWLVQQLSDRESSALKQLWRSVPREVCHAAGLGSVAYFGGLRSAATYLACALVYEAFR